MPAVSTVPDAWSWEARTKRDQRRRESRRERRKLLGWLRVNSDLKSQRQCGIGAVPGEQATIVKRGDRAHLIHVNRCNRLDCPECGPGVAERETADIGLAITTHYANGGSVALVTLTLRHVLGQPLLVLLAALAKAWTSVRTSRNTRSLWSELTVGHVRKLEVSWGGNGWHPHLHLLVFIRPDVDPRRLSLLFENVFATWAGRLVSLGLGRPSRERGLDWKVLDLAAAHEKVANYVAKDAGREVASAGSKRARRSTSRTVYELLVDAACGDGVAQLRYLEYEDAMRGKNRIRWTDGLRQALLDPELLATADESGQGRPIAVLTAETDHGLRVSEATGGIGVVDLLEVAERHEDDAAAFLAIEAVCREHGIPDPLPPAELCERIAQLRPPPRPPLPPAQARLW